MWIQQLKSCITFSCISILYWQCHIQQRFICNLFFNMYCMYSAKPLLYEMIERKRQLLNIHAGITGINYLDAHYFPFMLHLHWHHNYVLLRTLGKLHFNAKLSTTWDCFNYVRDSLRLTWHDPRVIYITETTKISAKCIIMY